jgi:hypothetical protein
MYNNETTETLFQMLMQAQTDYYNSRTQDNENKLQAITAELKKRGEKPLGW